MNSADIATSTQTLRSTLKPELWALLSRLAAGDVTVTAALAASGICARRVLCSPPRYRPLLHLKVGHTSRAVEFYA